MIGTHIKNRDCSYPQQQRSDAAIWRVDRRIVVAIILCFLIVAAAIVTAVSAQDAPETGSDATCSLTEQNIGFERHPTPAHRITATFIVKPNGHADVGQIKTHVLYSHILGRFASTHLYESSSRQCSLGAAIDASLDLHFELFSIGKTVHNECSLSRCARRLSDLLQSMDIDQPAFLNTINRIVETFRKTDSVDIRYPNVSMQRALLEIYRHIYPAGTNERILADLSPKDFIQVTFEEFAAWFEAQQAALRTLIARSKSEPLPEALRRPPSVLPTDNVDCGAFPYVSIDQLNIDHHGWGHRSILLIKNGFQGSGLGGISNAALRAFCPPGKRNDLLNTMPWKDMAGRVTCYRAVFGQDRWLILFAKQAPAVTAADMQRYAEGIAQALQADRCSIPEPQLILVNFLQQR